VDLKGIFFFALALSAASSAGAQESRAEPAPPVPTRLASGFTPDPLHLPGVTHGASGLAARAPGCRGFVGEAPDQIVELTTRFGFLRFFVTSPGDVTLAVRTPEGRWMCDGEALEGAPREQGAFPPGIYEVWIGSVRTEERLPYELLVTEFRSVTPATGRGDDATPVGAGAEIGLDVEAREGRSRDRRLSRGFLPDPRIDGGGAGGAIDAALIGGGCRGRIAAQPNHVLTLRTEFDYFRIEISEARRGVTLIVRTPEGRFLCRSPNGSLPFVERDSWNEGRYLIWVGGPPETDTPYRILYTEVRPAD
jgi:hypothetical protein